MNITGLKIPTGGRQTSWLFTSMTEELNWGPPRNNSSLVVRAGLEPATSGFQVRRPNHSATLPPPEDRSFRSYIVDFLYVAEGKRVFVHGVNTNCIFASDKFSSPVLFLRINGVN